MYVTYFLINSVLNVQECTKYAKGEKTVAKTTLLLFFRLFFLFSFEIGVSAGRVCVCILFRRREKIPNTLNLSLCTGFHCIHTLTHTYTAGPSASDVSNEKNDGYFTHTHSRQTHAYMYCHIHAQHTLHFFGLLEPKHQWLMVQSFW